MIAANVSTSTSSIGLLYLKQPLLLNPVSASVGDVIRQSEDPVGINPSKGSCHGSVRIQLLLPVKNVSIEIRLRLLKLRLVYLAPRHSA